jgi:carboxymethylenebutenolidase
MIMPITAQPPINTQPKALKEYTTFQRYFIEEFYDDFKEGSLSRRNFIRRLVFITGSITAANSIMTALGMDAKDLPKPTESFVNEMTFYAQTVPVVAPQSPLSVAADDPGVKAQDVRFESQGETITGYLAEPAEAGSYPAVLVCHENRGLTEHIRDVARRFAKAGYVALAIDLLSREGGTASHDRDEIPALLSGVNPERHVNDFIAGYAYLQSLSSVEAERIGMTGYCFGGGVTWRVATALPTLKAAVPFYGPGPELSEVPNIQAAVLGVYAEFDERINAGKAALEQALKEAGVTYQMNVYPGVNHAFHNDTGERYVAAQATRAWQDTLAWFEQYLKG